MKTIAILILLAAGCGSGSPIGAYDRTLHVGFASLCSTDETAVVTDTTDGHSESATVTAGNQNPTWIYIGCNVGDGLRFGAGSESWTYHCPSEQELTQGGIFTTLCAPAQ